MTSRIRRRIATLAVLPVTVTLLGIGLASPASAADESGSSANTPSQGGTGEGLKIIDLGDTGRFATGTAGNVF
ncbi:MAG: hypothetical protein M3460_11585 [Actinomycetota bacterium]|jgi:hypothetical protein|nr:hypothetical protein [Actinomycetota bacterium]